MPFALGMRAAATVPAAPTAFLWGINGAASVCASVLGIVIALFFGISAAFWAGALAYGLALASMVAVARGNRRTSPDTRPRPGRERVTSDRLSVAAWSDAGHPAGADS
jgi:hypothetical protein